MRERTRGAAPPRQNGTLGHIALPLVTPYKRIQYRRGVLDEPAAAPRGVVFGSLSLEPEIRATVIATQGSRSSEELFSGRCLPVGGPPGPAHGWADFMKASQRS